MKDGQFNIVLEKLAGNFREKLDGLSEKRGLNRRILKFEHQKKWYKSTSGINQLAHGGTE